MALRLFFEYDGTVIQMPVNPEQLEVERKGGNKSSEVINLGEITLIKDRKLAVVSIEGFLPSDDFGPYVLTKGDFEDPQFYIDFFNTIVANKEPCRFVVSDTEINMLVSIENFSHTNVHGTDDIDYTLEIKEYRQYSAKRMVIKESSSDTTIVTTASSDDRETLGFAVGDTVVASGQYWASSYGDPPYGTFDDFTGKVSHIVADTDRAYRYHITTTAGAYRGWVSADQLSYS